MSYLGNTPETYNFSAGADRFSGNASATVFTLSRRVTSANDVIAVIESVPQDPFSAYTIAANNTSGTSDITFTSAPPSGTNNIYVSFRATQLVTFNQVTASQIVPTGVSAGVYGGSSAIPVIQVNAQGQVTSASNSALSLNSITGDLTVSGNATINGTGFTKIATGTTAQRPTSNTAGYIRYNTTLGYPEWYDNTNKAWTPFTRTSGAYSIEYLIVAGGGGGGGGGASGNGGGGGGGAGGHVSGTMTVLAGTTYTATIGSGGAGSVGGSVASGSSGANSSFPGATTAVGGGGGAGGSQVTLPVAGGSGGGGSDGGNGASGTPGQGNPGGSSSGGAPARGGGGGGGGVGTGGTGTSGAGAPGGGGVNWQSVGTFYAGGGGGGSDSGTPAGDGGSGGGGNGGGSNHPVSAGTTNTGGGGGGGTYIGVTGGSGGSGVVIIRYLGGTQASGGTVTNAGGYTYHTFTSTGSFIA
jgi:hypothetical protein